MHAVKTHFSVTLTDCQGVKMPEAEVLYSDVKYTKTREKGNGTASPSDDTTYSEVKISKPPKTLSEQTGPQQPAVPNGRSPRKLERVAVVILSVLLAAAGIALAYLYHRCHVKPCAITVTQTCLGDGKCHKCEAGWERLGEKCFFFSSKKLIWSDSKHACEKLNGKLVKIETQEEQAFLQKEVMHKMEEAEDKFWIGLTDSQTEGTWLWTDGSPLNKSLTFWLGNEPDDWPGEDPEGEDCVRMGEKGGAVQLKSWLTKSCKKPHKYICEKKTEIGHTKCT